ncbi:HAD family hydrolase [Portibacter marinus]|uniref:HAD family hydrolase n=1 Tax=Portibacter marinus TaxID=2898660 RepID=UPI001F23FB45|nr:HAD family phosphatase [Portibacter marinus]
MIKAVIFDFGNVLYELDFDLFYKNFSDLLKIDVSPGFPEKLQRSIVAYERGKINTETFIWNFQHYTEGEIDALDVIKAWNSLLKGFPQNRWEFLKQWGQKYKLYLLSNINELHLSKIYQHMKTEHGQIDFETKYFDAVFYSHLIGRSKPDIDIYQYVEEGLGLKGEEIFFVDDRMDNIIAAQERGWSAVCHDPGKDIVDLFKDYIEPHLQ